MKLTVAVQTFAAAVMLLVGLSSAAQATVIIQNYTVSATPGLVLSLPGRGRFFFFDNVTPFTLQAGDSLQVHVTFDGPVSMQDNGPNTAELAVLQFGNQTTDPDLGYASSSLLTFDGVTGDYLGDPAAIVQSAPSGAGPGSGAFTVAAGGDLTNSTFSFTGLTFTADFSAIDSQNQPLTYGFVLLLDDLDPVPAPGALALLALGLFGIGGLRRKRNAA